MMQGWISPGCICLCWRWKYPILPGLFSGGANTQALLIYLKSNSPNLYYSRISRCHPPPLLNEVLSLLLQPLQGLLPCCNFWNDVLFTFPGACFSTNSSFGPIHSAVKEFLFSVNSSACFKFLNFWYHEIEIWKKKLHTLQAMRQTSQVDFSADLQLP